ncbi:MAG TPA: right-handed parallel beta-helix repeat-containing protein [Acidimicrobiales bacterium]|nr:right-handed parallel beta-helix repeat-containing protein [Acidimicrobiales bacterium]
MRRVFTRAARRALALLVLALGVALPLTVVVATPTASAGTVTIPAGDNTTVAETVATSPAGTTFILASGTHTNFSVVPKARDGFTSQPGTVLDGGGTVPVAFTVDTHFANEGGVTISGASSDDPLVIENYDQYDCGCSDPYTLGVVNPRCNCTSHSGSATNWSLTDVEITDSATLGLEIADGMAVNDGTIDGNGTAGLGGSDNLDTLGKGVLIENSDISSNGPPPGDLCPQATACAGIHLAGSEVKNVSLVNDTVDGNNGVGVWFDTVPGPNYVESDQIDTNAASAVRDEASGPLVVSNNVMDGDAANEGAEGAGIVCASCNGLTASTNTITDIQGAYGILILQDNREYQGDVVRNIAISGNTVAAAPGTTLMNGVSQCTSTHFEPTMDPSSSPCSGAVFAQSTITFTDDTYVCSTFLYGSPLPLPVSPPPPGEPYPGGGTPETLSFAAWQAAGFDVGGSATSDC